MTIDFVEEEEVEILQFIHKNYGVEIFTPGLMRTKPLFSPYVNKVSEQNVKVTIVAGTNGKGQTANTLVHFLENTQLTTALWTSPHIMSIRERFYMRGRNLNYSEIKEEIYRTHEFLLEKHRGEVVSFYEFLFLVFLRLAFDTKNKNPLKYLVLEVGLGGRLDAVNHFNADCACITSISRDHQTILGSRYDQILSEKIAVTRKGKPLFTQFKLKYLNQLAAKYCEENGVFWKPLQISPDFQSNYFKENQKMAQELFLYLLPGREVPNLDFIPTFKGRREEMTFKGNTLIFIGAHNIDGIRRMVESLDSMDRPSSVLVSFSKRSSNELFVMLKTLVNFFDDEIKLKLTSFIHPKALETNEVMELHSKFNKGLLDFVTDWKTDLSKSENQKILVCGSYYFIGEVQRFICLRS